MVYAQIQDKGREAKVDACFRFYDTVGPKGSGFRTPAEVFYGDTVPRNAASTARRWLMYLMR